MELHAACLSCLEEDLSRKEKMKVLPMVVYHAFDYRHQLPLQRFSWDEEIVLTLKMKYLRRLVGDPRIY